MVKLVNLMLCVFYQNKKETKYFNLKTKIIILNFKNHTVHLKHVTMIMIESKRIENDITLT